MFGHVHSTHSSVRMTLQKKSHGTNEKHQSIAAHLARCWVCHHLHPYHLQLETPVPGTVNPVTPSDASDEAFEEAESPKMRSKKFSTPGLGLGATFKIWHILGQGQPRNWTCFRNPAAGIEDIYNGIGVSFWQRRFCSRILELRIKNFKSPSVTANNKPQLGDMNGQHKSAS